ncbi:MAG: ABC transporter ATP-binding protein [Puniceicoccaceae bacterium]
MIPPSSATKPDLPPVFEISSLIKQYTIGDEVVHALAGVDLTIEPGAFLSILGPSGSGKSTLMHILGFMDRPDRGRIAFEGQDVSSISARRQAWYRANRIGFIFQAFNLLPRLSVFQNVTLPLSYGSASVSSSEIKKRATEALDQVAMGHRINHRPNQLSGGERQRVAIARSLINQPAIILGDEPTGNLDSVNVDRTLDLFADLNAAGQTIVLVTHDQHVADRARGILRFQDGKIVERIDRPS